MAVNEHVILARRPGMKVSLLLCILVLTTLNGVHGFFGEWGPDLEGPWCATRPGEDCCDGRDDDCAVPILGTECYCDIFCNQTAYDCCPDYWRHCHGHQVPATTPRPTTLPPPRPTRDTLEREVNVDVQLAYAEVDSTARRRQPTGSINPCAMKLRHHPDTKVALQNVVAPCFRDGVAFRPGEAIHDNCNNCTCELYEVPSRRYEWRCTQNVCLLRPELIEAVNDGPNYFWSARNYSSLWGLTLDEGIRHRLGTFQLSDNVVDMTPIKVEDDVLPEAFDARQKWPTMLHPISDQGNCASSWAHSTAAVASDRLSIESEGAIKDRLSVQHLVSCNTQGQLGCNGGHLDRAWWFLRQTGDVRDDELDVCTNSVSVERLEPAHRNICCSEVVSEECYPYTSGKTSAQGSCLITENQSGQRCPSGIQYKSDTRYKATPPYRIRPLEREIMKEIMDNGPVQATMLVREDFFMYNRGVYKYTGLTSLRRDSEEHMKSGFHSVRIIGWGAERTQQGDIIKYWICANSWGTDWGEDGYFRIVRGNDESSIESYVIGVWGKVTGDPALRVLLENRRRLRTEKARKRRHLRQLRLRGERQRRRHRRHHAEHQDNPIKSHRQTTKKHKLNGTAKQNGQQKEFKHQRQRKPGKGQRKHNNSNHNTELKHTRQHIKAHSPHTHKYDSSDDYINNAQTNDIKDKIIYDLSESMYV